MYVVFYENFLVGQGLTLKAALEQAVSEREEFDGGLLKGLINKETAVIELPNGKDARFSFYKIETADFWSLIEQISQAPLDFDLKQWADSIPNGKGM